MNCHSIHERNTSLNHPYKRIWYDPWLTSLSRKGQVCYFAGSAGNNNEANSLCQNPWIKTKLPGLLSACFNKGAKKAGNTEGLISQGYELLKKRQLGLAVNAFQAINPQTQLQNERKVVGLARALYPQQGKAKEALALLNQLPASGTRSTLLTKSRILQAMEHYEEAEKLLKQIVRPEAGDPETGKACNYHETNLGLARLWQAMGKPGSAERLLIASFRQKSTKAGDRFMMYCEHVGENGSDESLLPDQAFNYVEAALQCSYCSEKRA